MSAQGQAAQGQGALPAKSILVGTVGCVGRAGGFWGPCPPSCVWEGTGDSQGHVPLAAQSVGRELQPRVLGELGSVCPRGCDDTRRGGK